MQSSSSGVVAAAADLRVRLLWLTLFRTVATTEGGVLGAAMLGAVAAGFFPDLAAAADRMVKTGACYTPDDATGSIYDAGYRRYRDLYTRLAGLA